MLNKKIVAFDLDGTLTESKQPLQKEMAEVLMTLANQKKVVIISGGSYGQFQTQFLSVWRKFTATLPLEEALKINKNLYLLPTSGCQIFHYDETQNDWQILAQEKLSEEFETKAKEALDFVIKSDQFEISAESFGPRVEDRGAQVTFSALGQEAPLDKKKVWDPDQKKRLKIKAKLEEMIPEVDISIGGATSIDILPKGFNKAVGLQKLLNLLLEEKSDLIFVGDALFPGGNDYSMHEAGFATIKVGGPTETKQLIESWLK